MKRMSQLSRASAACLAGLILTFAFDACAVGATEDKYKVTNAEKAACTIDAMRLCSETYPDEDALLNCMKVNRASLSSTCRVAFDAGVRRRHL